MGRVPAPLTADPERTLQNKRVILAGGNEAQRRAMRAAMVAMGAQVHLLGFQDAATARIPRLGGTPADGLVYLLSPTAPSHEAVQERVVEVFGLLQTWARGHQPAAANLGFLAIGDAGHSFGLDGQHPHAWTLGALAGMAKSYAQERPQSRGLVIDWSHAPLNAELCTSSLAAWLSRGPCELIYEAQAWQTLARTDGVEIHTVPLRDGATVVATGGAQGVTYLLLRALAQKTRLKVVILARTTGVDADNSPLHNQTPEAEKSLAQAALASAGERVTPMAVRRWIDNQHKRVQIAENLTALRALGSEVELLSCDIGNSAALARIIAGVAQRLGACDLLLHGAGVEESKLLADKDAEAVVRAYAPKAAAALQLWQGLKPRRMVTMGSVAGRFGNIGQVDYAAANETLAALARAPGLNILNLAWTAWRDVGMATRGSTRQVLEQAGVDLLPADDGVAMGAALIQSDAAGDVVVSGSLGALAAHEVPYAPTAAVVAAQAVPTVEAGTKLLRLQEHDATAQTWTFARTFDPQQDPGLLDHRIGGTLVIPGVVGLEMVVQSAAYVLQKAVRYVRDIRFALPIKLFRDAPLEVYSVVQKAEAQLVVSVCSDFTGPDQRKIRRVHYSAVVPENPPLTSDATPAALEMACDPHVAHADIYKRYFHGPRFQVLDNVERLGDNGADGRVHSPMAGWLAGMETADYVSAPWLREAGFQVAGLWEMAEIGRMALPSAIDELYIGKQVTHWDGYVVRARRRRSEAQGCTFDVYACDAQGNPCDVMLGYRTIAFRDLTADERFDPARPPQDNLSAGTPNQLTVQLKEVEALFSGDLEAALEHYLVPMEIARFRTLKVRKRQLDWLAVRIAAKRLIRESCFGREAAIVPYNAIALHRDAMGAPLVEIIGEKGPPPNISMSHSAGIAAAFLSPRSDVRCGIDVESVQERDPTFAQTYFSANEQILASSSAHPAQMLTALWAVKEATLKALGVGARVDFRDVEVSCDQDGWRVMLHHEAAKRAEALGASAPQIDVDSNDQRVMARVLLPVSGVASNQQSPTTQVRA